MYQCWQDMKQRCTNPKNHNFANYGGRGISFCEAWKSFAVFLEDMGDMPDGMTLDRIDGNGNYCKENCRWADRVTQHWNRRTVHNIEFRGECLPVSEWARRIGIHYTTLFERLRTGWPVEIAITAPAGTRIYKKARSKE